MRLGQLVRPIIKTIAAVCVLGVLMLLVEFSYRPAYDQSGPNYRRVDRLRPKLDNPATSKMISLISQI